MNERQFERLIRLQLQTLAQQALILGDMHCVKEAIAESLIRIHALEAYIERGEKTKS